MNHLDADGDEILSSAEPESSDGLLHMLEERLALGQRRKGMYGLLINIVLSLTPRAFQKSERDYYRAR